jgi:MinD superfamily P-loop ATPase
MRIAVASGKGGTGKTTVATSLALSLSTRQPVLFLDCDVEAPNSHLYLQPSFLAQKEAVILLPQIDATKCSACGKCVEVCQFHALALIGKKVLVFPQLCHGCGTCTLNCPENAISEKPNPIGALETGQTDTGIDFARGVLSISEPMSTPIIRQLKRWKQGVPDQITILDAPPGASCSVVETVRGSDFVLLVTEPTPLGLLHDLNRCPAFYENEHSAGLSQTATEWRQLVKACFCKTRKYYRSLLRIPFVARLAERNGPRKTTRGNIPGVRCGF